MAKLGVGIITCNRNEFLKGLLATLPTDVINEIVIVNDGSPDNYINVPGVWLQNDVNLGPINMHRMRHFFIGLLFLFASMSFYAQKISSFSSDSVKFIKDFTLGEKI